MNNLQKLSQNTLPLIQNDNYYEISIYNDSLSTKFIIESTIKLKKAFPALTKDFFDIFSDRIKENNYTDKRLEDSINYVIDNCVYPTPTIAQFISFDKKVKLFKYEEIVKMLNDNSNVFKSYKSVKIGNLSKPLYAHVTDIEQYGLELWNK